MLRAFGAMKRRISAALRRMVWNTYIGEYIGRATCACCGAAPITPFTFQCGHVVAEARGGPTVLQNLRPICASCNASMGTKDMRVFMGQWTPCEPMEWE